MRLETQNVVLRELTLYDFAEAHAYSADPRVSRYETWGPNTEDETRRFLQRCVGAQTMEYRTSFDLAVTRRSDGVFLGACSLRASGDVHRQASLGYSLAYDYWGRGYATEVAQALVRFGLDELGLRRVWAVTHVDNIGSVRVLEKAGMEREGRMRDARFVKGSWADFYIYGIVRRT